MTKIEWTDATWNPIVGCSVVSPGCTNCYAMRMAGTRLKTTKPYRGLTQDAKAGPVWTGEVRFLEERLSQPLKWRKPRRVFVDSMSDLFHEAVPDYWIDQVRATMACCPQHVFQVLTKRPERMRDYHADEEMPDRVEAFMCEIIADRVDPNERRTDDIRATALDPHEVLPNLWLGVSVEDQTRANERIPVLLDTLAAVRFLSVEPLLGPVDLQNLTVSEHERHDALRGTLRGLAAGGHTAWRRDLDTRLDWVICGGESGPRARPMDPDWARSLRDQCQAAGVAFFMKQFGSRWARQAGADAHGADMCFWPEDLRRREFPNVQQ